MLISDTDTVTSLSRGASAHLVDHVTLQPEVTGSNPAKNVGGHIPVPPQERRGSNPTTTKTSYNCHNNKHLRQQQTPHTTPTKKQTHTNNNNLTKNNTY